MDPQVPFLRAGGDSLGALRAVTAMREIFDPGIPVTIRTLLHGATAADCAAALRATPDGPEFESLASDYMGAGADATGPDPNPGTAPNTGMDPDTETDTDTTKEAQFA
ncbi:acyl carrier protein [Corynebacterium freneyi]|nr:acyl carrier protein [Corynebacterium freneyi]MCG7438421.1 acyl carrier protein [Corynebacterium freneyi]